MSADSSDVAPAGAGRRLHRSSSGTLHHQLFRELSELIASGTAKPGDKLPTEEQLVEEYGVSRTTVRRAVDELRRMGLVERKPGRGTYVSHPPLRASIPHLHAVADEIEALGFVAGVRSVTIIESTADAHTAQALGLEIGDPVTVVRRVRTANDMPVYVGDSTLNTSLVPALREADFSTEAIFRVVERTAGQRVERAVQWMSAVPASNEIAGILEVPPSSPVLRLDRVLMLESDLPVVSITGFFHGGLYRHYTEVRARDA